jgi:hypothetical protein
MAYIRRTGKTFAAIIAANLRTYRRKVTGAELGSANLPTPTFAAEAGKGCELNSPFGWYGANLPWCNPCKPQFAP